MRLTKIAGVILAVLLVGGAVATAKGAPNDRVTGGGQVLVEESGGAGDTIAFTMQGAGTNVKGQFQYVDRTGGTGQGQTHWHGQPICLSVEGKAARATIKSEKGALYDLYVVDNGEGSADGNDIVGLSPAEDAACGEDDDDEDTETALARGNAQVYDAP